MGRIRPTKSRWNPVRAGLGLALLGVAVSVGAGMAQPQRAVPPNRAEIQWSFAPLVKRTAPAVVNIYTKRTVRTVTSPLFNDPFFRRFFGDQIPGGRQERTQNSLGSGVIVDPTGLVITNNHVIKGASEITVILADRREFEATVLRSDDRTDLAVLRVAGASERLPYIELADSDDLQVGDLVLAIGNPFGVGQTVTSGIVSAVARTMAGITDYRSFIQTDAAINPGNSGGALVTMDGRLVGINSAIYSKDGGSIGIGFAIPANMVHSVLAGVTSGGKLVRPWFGASVQTVTAELASSLGLPRPMGVLVTDVSSGGPADRAGLRRGDVILRVEGRDVADNEELKFRIATRPVGASVPMVALREGRERSVDVALVAPPESPPRDSTPLSGNQPLAGATVANLSPALADEIGFEGIPRGVIITDVRRGSAANRVGLEPGDLVVRVNEREIKGVDELRRAVAQASPQWRIAIRRGDRVLNLVVGG